MIACPICQKQVRPNNINAHLDSGCEDFVGDDTPPPTQPASSAKPSKKTSFFVPRNASHAFADDTPPTQTQVQTRPQFSSPITTTDRDNANVPSTAPPPRTTPKLANAVETLLATPTKRRVDDDDDEQEKQRQTTASTAEPLRPPAKKLKLNPAAPLAERMRPRSLEDITGQTLVGPNGVLRNLILSKHIPSMILWGGPGTGKTTIARLIASTAGTRFVEINSTSTGVAECKKIFAEAKNELALTGRRTVLFCDEIHRFSKSQQDVFLGPVESGVVTLVGATTENPSFKVVNALLSRCRTFTLEKLGEEDVFAILKRALLVELPGQFERVSEPDQTINDQREDDSKGNSYALLAEDDFALLRYLAAFADGDARTGLNLLELAIDLCRKPKITTREIKDSLTQTLVYDRAGDQHYDTISAFHKSVRGSDPDAALYYLARMLQSGEDPLYVARRMVVIASEDVGLADNSLLSLATATYTAAEKIGMPECRINLGHCAVALALAPKSVRAYRGLSAAYSALKEPGVAGLPVPYHIRNAPTKLMKDLGYGKEYKYNPDYVDGRVVQDYLPEKLQGRKFLVSADLGEKVDPDLAQHSELLKAGDEDVEDGRDHYDDNGDLILNPDGD